MAMKVKENDKLTSHFQEINEKIEKGLLIPKKQEQNEEENPAPSRGGGGNDLLRRPGEPAEGNGLP